MIQISDKLGNILDSLVFPDTHEGQISTLELTMHNLDSYSHIIDYEILDKSVTIENPSYMISPNQKIPLKLVFISIGKTQDLNGIIKIHLS